MKHHDINKIVADCVKNVGKELRCGYTVEDIDILVRFLVECLPNAAYCCDGEYFLAIDINAAIRDVVEHEYEVDEEISSYTDNAGRRHSVRAHDVSDEYSRFATKSRHEEYIDAEIVEDIILDEDGCLDDVVSTTVRFQGRH